MESLGKLFGSVAKVKIMRLFLFNPGTACDLKSIAIRTQVSTIIAKREIQGILESGLIKKKDFSIREEFKKKNGIFYKKVKMKGFILDGEFPYLQALQALLLNANPFTQAEISKRLGRAGIIKLIIVSGVFIQNWESRIDLLVVGDRLDQRKLKNIVKAMEAELGRELRYSTFETKEFQYRISMYDKLIRDVLDFPHQKLINKIGIL